jgi:hypothetical protein
MGNFPPFLGGGAQSTITVATADLPAPNDDECGAVAGMSGKGNRSSRRKLATVPLYLPQIPHDLTRSRTRAGD